MSTAISDRVTEVYGAQAAERTMERLARAACPEAVFGQPIERGELTIIPCCEVALGMGFGGGAGTTAVPEKASKPSGEGMGAGGGARGRPIATIVIARDAVRIMPIYDVTRLVLAGLTTASFAAFWIARLVSMPRPRHGRGRPTRRDIRARAQLAQLAQLARLARTRRSMPAAVRALPRNGGPASAWARLRAISSVRGRK